MKGSLFTSPTFFLVTILLGASSCHHAVNALLPMSSGRPYEVMVVCDKDTWQSIAGRALHKALDYDIPGLPQPEASFRVSRIDNSGFNQITEIFRNIIVVNVNSELYTQTRLHYKRNVYSSPQVILYIDTPSIEDMVASLQKNGLGIVDFFTQEEFNREVDLLKERHNFKLEAVIAQKFGCTLHIPSEISSSKHGKNFLWASNNTATGMQNFCIYSYKYHSTKDITKVEFLSMRDSILGANIPGELPNMHMHTDPQTTVLRKIKVNGKVRFEARGLWEMENDCMGGPFVSHSIIDIPNKRVLVVEGFIYAPESKKRILIRNVEGALYTLQLPNIIKKNNN